MKTEDLKKQKGETKEMQDDRKALPDGAEIIPENFQSILQKAKVTVLLLAHNQEKTIRDAAESILDQRTDFPVVLLVHDDASEDDTGKILCDLQKSHPDRMVVITERQNQYTQGVKITQEILLPLVQSPYTAFLDGDDRWIRRDKLQKQVHVLEQKKDVTLCVSNVLVEEAGTERTTRLSHRLLPGPLSLERILRGEITQFGTFVGRTEAMRLAPDLCSFWFGDLALLGQNAIQGKVWYLPEPLSLYRRNTKGSVSDMHHGKAGSDAERRNAAEKIIFLRILNEETGGRKQEEIEAEIRRIRFRSERNHLLTLLAEKRKQEAVLTGCLKSTERRVKRNILERLRERSLSGGDALRALQDEGTLRRKIQRSIRACGSEQIRTKLWALRRDAPGAVDTVKLFFLSHSRTAERLWIRRRNREDQNSRSRENIGNIKEKGDMKTGTTQQIRIKEGMKRVSAGTGRKETGRAGG